MTAKKYTKKPEVVEAIQWTGDNLKEVLEFTGRYELVHEWFESFDDYAHYVGACNSVLHWRVDTSLSRKIVSVNVDDYIIKNLNGFVPCKKSLFEKTYVDECCYEVTDIENAINQINDMDVFPVKEDFSNAGIHFVSTYQAKSFVTEVLKNTVNRLKNATR